MKNNYVQALFIATALAAPFWSSGQTVSYFEGFDDDFVAARDVPDLVDASLSSPFSDINAGGLGELTIRDRGAFTGGNGGGFTPISDAFVDFSFGGGSYITFKFPAGAGYVVGASSTVTFDVVAYGSDGGILKKFVSSDGVNFTQVGDNSDANGPFAFSLATGGANTWFRLQIGSASIFDGVWVDHFSASLNVYQDDDCDGVANANDRCPGGDDSVNNNGDNLPDCAYPPAYANIIAAWKCGPNKVSVCHNGHTICISKNALAAHIGHGDYLGPCDNASCTVGERSAAWFGAEAELPSARVKLQWVSPGSEEEIERFEVEKSADGTRFEPLLALEVPANSSDRFFTEYDFAPLEGINFYRLKTVWANGAFAFAPIEEIQFQALENFTLFPNPAGNAVQLYLPNPEGRPTKIQVFNSMAIKMLEMEVVPGGQPVNLDLDTLKDGLYFVFVSPEGRRAMGRRLVVAKE